MLKHATSVQVAEIINHMHTDRRLAGHPKLLIGINLLSSTMRRSGKL
jgi:radical SAM superfamily enzyme with C-terminal helix-hairpin-helix motif